MSGLFSDAPTGRKCRGCGQRTRPPHTSPVNFPGTIVEQAKGLCGKCYQRSQRTDVLPEDWLLPAKDPEPAPWGGNPLGPLTASTPTLRPSTPNPYTCPCGYRVITHTTPTASRYHKAAARRHARECRGAV